MDPSVGHLNGILAWVGGNLNNNFQKSQMPGGLPGGVMLKLRFDRYIIVYVTWLVYICPQITGILTANQIVHLW